MTYQNHRKKLLNPNQEHLDCYCKKNKSIIFLNRQYKNCLAYISVPINQIDKIIFIEK